MPTDKAPSARRPTVPGRLLYLTEPVRAVVDFGLLTSSAPLLPLMPRAQKPGTHPVLVLPGLGAGDAATFVLRRALRHLGYRAHGWGLGINGGPTPKVRDGIPARLDELTGRYQEPISVIGWSLGGLYARQLAWRRTESVRQVITLATPVRLAATFERQGADMTHPADMSGFPQWPRWSAWASWYGDFQVGLPDGQPPAGAGSLPVPTTSIYTVMDGIVGWQVCLTDVGRQAENIAVATSHMGVLNQPAVLFAIADRLAQPAGDWIPFRPPPWLRAAYPRGAAIRNRFGRADSSL